MSDLHELVAAVKALALELGRTPLRDEFARRITNAKQKLLDIGGFSVLLQAAGLETNKVRKCRLSREEVYGRDIAEVIESHTPKIVESTSQSFEPILAIGDTHFPFAHKPTLEKIYRFAEKHQPKHIVQLGDLNDQFAHSRFPASRNYYKPDEEMELARMQGVEFWLELQKACPKAKCWQITGNHDARALKLILNAAPTLESLITKSINALYEFDGVQTIHDYREELMIQGVMFHHGYMTQLGRQRDFVQNNLVTGHTHKGGVLYRPLQGKTIWHLDAGFVGDAESKAMSYTPQKASAWTLGWGFIDEYSARFIPA